MPTNLSSFLTVMYLVSWSAIKSAALLEHGCVDPENKA